MFRTYGIRYCLVNVLAVHFQHRTAATRIASKAVRSRFMEYFVNEHEHTYIKSSPVVPFSDPTVPFVNAGMNQFKSIFLGQSRAPCNRAANSQKCIRVGGKHNDLDAVGTDGFHHTFFEMLGSWSFGDYFKEQACRLAWDLLTGPYALNPNRLYVTYFGGDKAMGLGPDLETQNIWKQIGVSPDHILPFGANDNFWEMGASGPCGPCTEIHFDHVEGRRGAFDRVNQGFDDLTEIWNLVFIQYNRSVDGNLKDLPSHHVDTGMGLERLVAVLQEEKSNYNTDLFEPLFVAVHKSTGATPYSGKFGIQDPEGLDAGYRILADHARMITVALSDGMFPDQNPKLRRIIRRALSVSKKKFGRDRGLLSELTNNVAESLADIYPEIGSKLKQTQHIISHEEDVFLSLRKETTSAWWDIVSLKPSLQGLDVAEMPGLLGGYCELDAASKSGSQIVSGPLAFKLYDTFGLDEEVVCQLAETLGLKVDIDGLRHLLDSTRTQSKVSHCTAETVEWSPETWEQLAIFGVNPTDDSFKYKYTKQGSYVFPVVESEVCAIVVDGNCVSTAVSGTECGLILNQTNFYHESGGQASDTGHLYLKNGMRIIVKDIVNMHGYLVHKVDMDSKDSRLHVGDTVMLEICPNHRLSNMRNHTATHLLNAALRRLLTATYQKSSRVVDTHLAFDFAVYGENFTAKDVIVVEQIVQSSITASIPVQRRTVSAQDLQTEDGVTLVPGEVYPKEDIHLIEIEAADILTSREACCGTHVLNTSDIDSFCITMMKAPSAGTRSLRAVTGVQAREAFHLGDQMLERLGTVSNEIKTQLDNATYSLQQVEALEGRLQSLRQELKNSDQNLLPYSVRIHCVDTIEALSKTLKDGARSVLRESFELEMQQLLKTVNGQITASTMQPFIVHFLQCSSSMDVVPLQRTGKLCPHLPILLLARSEGMMKAKCCVPKELASDRFNAKVWMQPVLAAFKAQGFSPRGQNELHVYNMKGKKVKEEELQTLVQKAVRGASEFAHVILHNKEQREQTT